MIYHVHLRKLIIEPVLDLIKLYSEDAIELLMFTCAVESNGGTYLQQLKGPALGIYQMEPHTHNDIWQNYLRKNNHLLYLLSSSLALGTMPTPERMVYDLFYATAMARIFYARFSKKLPDQNDVDGIWEYYKEFYNTPKGKAKKDNCIKVYNQFINP